MAANRVGGGLTSDAQTMCGGAGSVRVGEPITITTATIRPTCG